MTHFLFACLFRFVPYIGIVTILMNDYPKFKVRAYTIRFIKHALLCFLLETVTWVTDGSVSLVIGHGHKTSSCLNSEDLDTWKSFPDLRSVFVF